MKEAGPHFIRVDNILSPEKLIVQLQIDRVKFLKQISPSGLLSARDRRRVAGVRRRALLDSEEHRRHEGTLWRLLKMSLGRAEKSLRSFWTVRRDAFFFS